ncbi:MAG: hypothetical protein K1X88_02020 [Nannocystaceae bacterium]|nr:hypothetical protein [Nannocystaceae bacterium]
MPRRAPDWLRRCPIAHRGLHGAGRPENSLAAFAAACDAGYGIELDVHRTRTGELVVMHDDTATRTTTVAIRTTEIGARDLARLRLEGTDEPVPRLRDVLALVRGRVPLVIELKSSRDRGPLERGVLAAIERYGGPVALQSFDPFTLSLLRRLAPAQLLGLLASDFRDSDLPASERFVLRRLLLAPLSRPDYIGYALRGLPCWPTRATRRLGLPLLAWTVDSPAALQRARALADNVIFEHVRP